MGRRPWPIVLLSSQDCLHFCGFISCILKHLIILLLLLTLLLETGTGGEVLVSCVGTILPASNRGSGGRKVCDGAYGESWQ